jgi:Flp pilus assembly protein TadD
MATSAELLARAVEEHRRGNLIEAGQLYRKVLEENAQDVNALHLLGLVQYQKGETAAAIASIQNALAVKPDFVEAYNNLGVALRAAGRVDDAVASFERALKLQPDYAAARSNLGLGLHDQGKFTEALANCQEAVRLRPHEAEFFSNLGRVLGAQGRLDEAIVNLKRALELNSRQVDVHNNLGICLRTVGRVDEAIAHFQSALQLRPDYTSARNNLGVALADQGKLEAAVATYQEALRHRSDDAQTYCNLGSALRAQGRLELAVTHLKRAIELKPDLVEAHINLGNALRCQGKLPEAMASFHEALRLDPDHVDAHWNRCTTLLSTGDFKQGWPEYEWRWKQPWAPPLVFPQPRWDGSALECRSILLCAEQGLGDTIQFVRYARLLRSHAKEVIVSCQKPLLPLLAGCPGIDRLCALGEEPTDFDVWSPLLSVPGLVGTTVETIPDDIPYLFAKRELVAHWRGYLNQFPGFRVGICWQGNRTYSADRHRSVPLAEFAPVAAIKGIQLFSIQKGAGTEPLPEVAGKFSVIDLGSRLDTRSGAFMDTAAVMQGLDLIITADTAIAHLAGALGVPVWTAISMIGTEWRWLLDREDTPWYPTMRLFRQSEPNDWGGVFQRMAAEFNKVAAG